VVWLPSLPRRGRGGCYKELAGTADYYVGWTERFLRWSQGDLNGKRRKVGFSLWPSRGSLRLTRGGTVSRIRRRGGFDRDPGRYRLSGRIASVGYGTSRKLPVRIRPGKPSLEAALASSYTASAETERVASRLAGSQARQSGRAIAQQDEVPHGFPAWFTYPILRNHVCQALFPGFLLGAPGHRFVP
jgi:hypothetical protein